MQTTPLISINSIRKKWRMPGSGQARCKRRISQWETWREPRVERVKTTQKWISDQNLRFKFNWSSRHYHAKRDKIVNNLCPVMARTGQILRKRFWDKIPVNENSRNLCFIRDRGEGDVWAKPKSLPRRLYPRCRNREFIELAALSRSMAGWKCPAYRHGWDWQSPYFIRWDKHRLCL